MADRKFIIEALTSADAVEVLALQKRAFASEAILYDDWSIPPMTETLGCLLEAAQASTVLKATEGQRVVGAVRGLLDNETCHVSRLCVDPELQGQGIGAALIHAIERLFPDAARFELFTGSRSEGNIRLYRRHGYEITGTKAVSERVTLVVMSKPAGAL